MGGGADCLIAKVQVSEVDRKSADPEFCSIYAPPAGFEPAHTAPEAAPLCRPDLAIHAAARLTGERMGEDPGCSRARRRLVQTLSLQRCRGCKEVLAAGGCHWLGSQQCRPREVHRYLPVNQVPLIVAVRHAESPWPDPSKQNLGGFGQGAIVGQVAL